MADIVIYLRESDRLLLDANGGELVSEDLYPSAYYTQKPLVRVYFRQSDGLSAYDGLNSGDGVNVAVDKDFTTSTPPMARTNSSITVNGTSGYIEFTLNTNTTQWLAAVTGSEKNTDTKMEIQVITAGQTDIKKIYQFPFTARMVIDDLLSDPSALPSGYPSYAQFAASFVEKAMFDAHSVVVANTDNSPEVLSMPSNTMLGRRSGDIESLTVSQIRTLLNVAAATDQVLKTLFDAQSVLAATLDDTPAAISMAERTLLGRPSGGNVGALTASQARELLGVLGSGDTVSKSLFDAHSILMAVADNSPAVLSMSSGTMLARRSGNIEALSLAAAKTWLDVVTKTLFDQYSVLVANTDNTPSALAFAQNTMLGRRASGMEALTISQVKNLLNVTGVYRTIWIPAHAMISRETNGATAMEIEWSTNDQNLSVYSFSASTQQYVQFPWMLPVEIDPSHLKCKFVWTNQEGASAEGVRMAIRARSFTDDDSVDQGWGTAQEISDVWHAQNDCHITDATATIVPAGSAAGGELCQFEIYRNVSHADDDMTGALLLLGAFVQYKESDTAPSAW